MDSLTQIVLGASVGELVCGKKAGNKALWWGAVAGTIPDLDVMASPFQDMVQQLLFHRSVTHSILFAVVMAPLFGWLVHRLHKNTPATFRDWTLLFFWGFITHSLLDCFTTWGTQLFWPFSSYPVAFHNIFVIDPLYTLPFLFCIIMVLFYKRTDSRRRFWNTAGLTISSLYMLLTLVNKYIVTSVFTESLREQHISCQRLTTKPTPFNSILWNVTAETDSGYYIGYYSLPDKSRDIKFSFFRKNHELLAPFLPDEKLETLLRITNGYYTVTRKGNLYCINDLRFGQLDGWAGGKEDFVFSYNIEQAGNKLLFFQNPNDLKKGRELLGPLWQRIKGI